MARVIRHLPATLATVLALGAGAIVLESGLERMSAVAPKLAAVSPSAALDAAARAVRRDPVDAASVSRLGLARLTLRDGEGAEAAFRVAARLGWRDPATQLYWMAVATDLGDYGIAAARADALLRQDARLRERPVLLARLERLPGGQRALAARLALRPEWFADYWHKLYPLKPDQLADRARVLDEPALRPARMTCEDVTTIANALAISGAATQAREILGRHCGRGLLADGGFKRARLSATSPLGWQFPGEGGLDIRLRPEADGKGQALEIASALPSRQVFASQRLLLAPGRYRVSWKAAGDGAARVVARLTCQQGTGEFKASSPIELSDSCPMQWLDLAIDPGAGAVAVDDVSVIRAR